MRVTRTVWTDWYVDGAESAVLVNDRVVVLSELATTLVDLIGDGEGIALADLTSRLTEEFGQPPGDPVEATRSRVRELQAEGVVDCDESEAAAS